MNPRVKRTSVFFDSGSSIAVCIPSIPPRAQTMLPRALQSVHEQQLQPAELHVVIDHAGEGAALTRQRALDAVSPYAEWVAFLDDDDYWYAHHLQVLSDLARLHQADFVYSWFSGNDPFPMHRGRQMDPDDPHHTTMNVMVKAKIARRVGFVDLPGEDWHFIKSCLDAGAVFAGTPEITWHYDVHRSNTSGRPWIQS